MPLKRFAWANGLLFVLLLLLIPQSAAQLPPPATPPPVVQDPIRVSVDLVVLHATVQNRGRASVSGLRKEDFQVYEDGVLQKIDSFTQDDIPVTVGLVIDNSGSMEPKSESVAVAALAFARSSHPADELFVVYFNENVTYGLPDGQRFTDKEPELLGALARIKADGLTALNDAITAGIERLRHGKWEKKVLLVLSDGADNASKQSLKHVMELAEQSNVIIYTVGLFEMNDPDRNPGVLKKLAKTTGGEAFFPQSLKGVVPICKQIASDIRSQYTITYAPTNTQADGRLRKIEVKARAENHGRLQVRTRTGYKVPLIQSAPVVSQRP